MFIYFSPVGNDFENLEHFVEEVGCLPNVTREATQKPIQCEGCGHDLSVTADQPVFPIDHCMI